jgi:hypothetical protein
MPTRRALLAAALAALPGCLAGAEGRGLSRPMALPAMPSDTPLRVLGGIEIDTGLLGFGGLSAVHLAPDLTLTVVSDLARFAEFRLSLDPALRPAALSLLRSGPLRDGAGKALTRGHAGDAEALAQLPDGTWLIAFERWHRIRAYRDLDGPGSYVEAPPGLESAPANAGLESLAVLADGRWLAIAEASPWRSDPAVTAAWIGGPGQWQSLGYRAEADFAPVDAAPLPDGGALVLERSFSVFGGFAGRLVRLPAARLAAATAATILQGDELLRLVPPFPTDNYEGLSVLSHEGRLLVAMVSDDNESLLQRTLLLLFELQT